MKRLKENAMLVIVSLSLLLFIPIAYYFCYALPQHNKAMQDIERDKLEYQREQDRLEKERIEEEALERENNYNSCRSIAKISYDVSLSKYCELGYKECKTEVDDYNRQYPFSQQTYESCDKYKYVDNGCFLPDKYGNTREQEYKDALAECDKKYGY